MAQRRGPHHARFWRNGVERFTAAAGRLFGIALTILGYWIKARKEESNLTAEFGAAFKEHLRHAISLISRFW